MDVTSGVFRSLTSARLQAQFLEAPDWTSTRSLANVLDSVVEATASGESFQVALPPSDSTAEHRLADEILALEVQVARYREHLARLHAARAVAPLALTTAGKCHVCSTFQLPPRPNVSSARIFARTAFTR